MQGAGISTRMMGGKVLLGLVILGVSVGVNGFIANGAEEPEKAETEETHMTLERLESLIRETASEVKGDGAAWEFTYESVRMMCITDTNYDRMRIVAPIAEQKDMSSDQVLAVLAANYDTALDARYATNQDVLFSAFIHPLSPLRDEEVASAIEQVAGLALTYGTTYQSGGLVFGR